MGERGIRYPSGSRHRIAKLPAQKQRQVQGGCNAQTGLAQSRRCECWALAPPRIGRAERSNKLVFVPTEDLSVLDPHFAGPRSRRTHSYLVFDTLYGIDTSWEAQPQMVEGHQVEEDGLTWTLRLRDGLRFHDKEPVLARDVVASIRRFAARITFADALMAATEELSGHPTIAPCGSV